MIGVVILPLLLAVSAEEDVLQQALARGEQVFVTSCATGYCHAKGGGAGGGGARLAARGFSQDYIAAATRSGRPGTAMVGFEGRLPVADLDAVVAYVASLNGIEQPEIGRSEDTSAAETKLSAQAEEGRRLFHDALRAFDRCATCHRVRASGVPVAEPIGDMPASAAALRKLETPQIATVSLRGEAMPALVVSRSESRVLFYDLIRPPPVLRTVAPDGVSIEDGNDWRHASVIGSYSDTELELILAYLREAAAD
jgi:mono/diheme cytochrome c family protein